MTNPATTLNPAQVLEDAADVLLIHGRCQGIGHALTGEFCALGAIAEVVEPGWYLSAASHYWSAICRNPAARTAVESLASQIGGQVVNAGIAVYDWNDAEQTTDDDVRDTLLLTAKTIRNGAAA